MYHRHVMYSAHLQANPPLQQNKYFVDIFRDMPLACMFKNVKYSTLIVALLLLDVPQGLSRIIYIFHLCDNVSKLFDPSALGL